jgi:CHAP domain
MPTTKRPGPTKGPAPNTKKPGTSPRATMPPPVPPKPAAPQPPPAASEEDAAKAVVKFAQDSVSEKVGSGECYDLADKALQGAGAKSAPDHGVITGNANYVWGREVKLDDVKPGDVLQFKNYAMKARVDKADGWSESKETRPHHTAVVESVGSDGTVVVIEQNIGKTAADKRTKRSTLALKGSSTKAGTVTTTVTVTGTVTPYRPVPKAAKP